MKNTNYKAELEQEELNCNEYSILVSKISLPANEELEEIVIELEGEFCNWEILYLSFKELKALTHLLKKLRTRIEAGNLKPVQINIKL